MVEYACVRHKNQLLKGSKKQSLDRFVEWQLFEVFSNLCSTNEMIMVQYFNIHFENRNINSIRRNKEIIATN